MNMEIGHNKNEFFPYCKIRFSQTMRLFDELLEILEILECVIQPIFEMKIEIPSGSMWNMVLKLGKNPA